MKEARLNLRHGLIHLDLQMKPMRSQEVGRTFTSLEPDLVCTCKKKKTRGVVLCRRSPPVYCHRDVWRKEKTAAAGVSTTSASCIRKAVTGDVGH